MPNVVRVRKEPYRKLLLRRRDEILASVRREPEALQASLNTLALGKEASTLRREYSKRRPGPKK